MWKRHSGASKRLEAASTLRITTYLNAFGSEPIQAVRGKPFNHSLTSCGINLLDDLHRRFSASHEAGYKKDGCDAETSATIEWPQANEMNVTVPRHKMPPWLGATASYLVNTTLDCGSRLPLSIGAACCPRSAQQAAQGKAAAGCHNPRLTDPRPQAGSTALNTYTASSRRGRQDGISPRSTHPFHPIRIACLFALFSTAATAASAGEPRVREGLVLWLDASAQPAAREEALLPALRNGDPVDVALDLSGSGRRIVQPDANRRPVFITNNEAAYFLFDGVDDFLPVEGPDESTSEMTLFILAAVHANPGGFSTLFATGGTDESDMFHFDLGPDATEKVSVLNAEGAGVSGFEDLLHPFFLSPGEFPFGEFQVYTVRSEIGENGRQVFFDGLPRGRRDRSDSRIGLERMTIASRLVPRDAEGTVSRGFFDGAIAEVLVYDRALSDEERDRVERALVRKIPTLPGADGHALEPVEDPPVVQMLRPGFTVHELPLGLTNLNNVRYRHDGKVVALGYDGRIHLLSDTTGDGLEDTVETFWDRQTLRAPIGMALTPEGYPDGDGVFVASKGKVSLILDSNRDGRADKEIIVADGWEEIFHGVDTLGVAIDPEDGSIYFSLGAANYGNPYLIDSETGEARYDIESIRGTVQRVSADFSEQETIATGVRFLCALAFNRHGDLFATEQEGATWLPNGNALDQLLHIEQGKHYGFPPRHPRHLPDVIDTPPVMEYGPQHQSTVGMVFNESVNGGPPFGPAHWESDAIITGQSRGKLWRTKLAKTPLGYVARNDQFASLSLTTVDACVSPGGDLLVVCHSGPPDWGSGPTGEGHIFKIRYTEPDAPQPVLGWAAAADEFRIAFDRPLDPADWADAKEKVRIEAGAYAGPGDRFEVVRPGYQTVRDQLRAPRRWVAVRDLSLSEDRRTMILSVPPQTEPVSYVVTLPVPEWWIQPENGIPQIPEIDVLLTLGGLEAHVSAPDERELHTVLPHPSLEASAFLTAGSSEHEAFLELARVESAEMTLRGAADVSNPFVPRIQEGSELDWDIDSDPFASARFGVFSDYSGEAEKVDVVDGVDEVDLVALTPVRAVNPSWEASGLFLDNEELGLRHPLSTDRIFVPWAEEPAEKEPPVRRERTDVAGNWLSGKRLYTGVSCYSCHTIRGRGLEFGPDLTNLIYRDRESVLKDIVDPSATITPEQAGSRITFTGGSVLSAIVRSVDAERVVVRFPGGAETEFPREEIVNIEPAETSLMPEGLIDFLTEEQIEDLLTYLLVNPLEPTRITRTDPPMPRARTLDEIVEVLGAFPPPAQDDPSPLRILLCAGPKTHGEDEHDYPLWLERWAPLLSLAKNVTVDTSMGFPSREQLAAADVTVFNNANPEWDAEKAALLDEYHERGGGVVYIHFAVAGGEAPDKFAERAGLAFTWGSRFRHGEMELVFEDVDHPIINGFPDLTFTDETYWSMHGDESRLNVLATSVEEEEPHPQLWTLERKQSRIFVAIPGHYMWTFDDPLYRLLVLRGIAWTAGEPVDRLAELITVGARVAR